MSYCLLVLPIFINFEGDCDKRKLNDSGRLYLIFIPYAFMKIIEQLNIEYYFSVN